MGDRYVVRESVGRVSVHEVQHPPDRWPTGRWVADFNCDALPDAKARAEALAAELNEAYKPRFYVADGSGKYVHDRTRPDPGRWGWVATLLTPDAAQDYADWLNDKEEGR